MLYVTFVYTADTELLKIAVNRLRQIDPEAVIYAAQDANAPLSQKIDGVRIITTNYPRNGNLNGIANLGGQLTVFSRLLDDSNSDYIIKFDADTWINDLTPFKDKKVDYLATENWEAFRPSGHIYRLSKRLVKRLIELYNERSKANSWPPNYSYPEDQTIYRMACLTSMPCTLIDFTSDYSVGMLDGGPGTYQKAHNAGVVHCGEPTSNGQRATREHVLLRMKILQHEINQLCQDSEKKQ